MSILSWLFPLSSLIFFVTTIILLLTWMNSRKQAKLLSNKISRKEEKQKTLEQEFQKTEAYAKSLQSDKVRLASLNDELQTSINRLKLKLSQSGNEISQQAQSSRRIQDELNELQLQNEILVENLRKAQEAQEQSKTQPKKPRSASSQNFK